MTSLSFQNLQNVYQEINILLLKQTELKKKKLKRQLTEEDEIDLEANAHLLDIFKERKIFWQRQVDKEFHPMAPKKPLVPFNKATIDDCIDKDGLDMNLDYIEPFSIPQETLHIPQEFPIPVPSDFLSEHLISIQKYFVINNEKASRMLIDALLLEVLKCESNDKLLGFCEFFQVNHFFYKIHLKVKIHFKS